MNNELQKISTYFLQKCKKNTYVKIVKQKKDVKNNTELEQVYPK